MAVAGVLIIILLTLRLVALFVSVRKRRRNKTHNVTGAGEAIEMGVACAPTLLNPAVTSTTRDNRVSLVEENIYEDMSGDLTEEGCSVVRMDSTKKHSRYMTMGLPEIHALSSLSLARSISPWFHLVRISESIPLRDLK